MEIRLAGIVKESITDGPGIRYTVFVQGCPHGCPGCHNPQTHDFSGGTFRSVESIFEEFKQNPMLKGITLSGGEPFTQPKELTHLAKLVHSIGKDVVTYSGWTYEELSSMKSEAIQDLLNETDMLVDGKFVEAQKNLELRFRGSENQRLIDMNRTKADGKIVLVE
ncbi:anaerobic ribonucleoside-triphosphate reductase activating protein [Scatolibacter rhodanostii]|uniref:anaerobic ribonucleoside-triphosphate reductase activating protein n=1 Tax=Scatolibacter rhodanostii TaxID=2014781 RepID=UPI000C07C36B|nr:anaerobic ribonucleoside-triphosphate reductase activating protein [Scatolibacter rhodanostii]